MKSTKNLDTIKLVDDINRPQSEQLEKLTLKTAFLEKRLKDRIEEGKILVAIATRDLLEKLSKKVYFKYYKTKKYFFTKKNNKFKNINKVSSTFDSLFLIGFTVTSVTLSSTGFGLIVLPITTKKGCDVAIATKMANEFLKQN